MKGIRIFQHSPPAFFCVTSVSFIRLKKVNCDSRILSEVHIELSFYQSCIFIFGCAGSSLLTAGFSLTVRSRGDSVVVVRGLLIAIASPAAEFYRVLGFSSVAPQL